MLNRMVKRGYGYLHATANYENNVVLWNQRNRELLPEPFVFVFPSEGAFFNPNPVCIVDNAPWSTRETVEGGRLFAEFILKRENQAKALEFGIRPADKSIDFNVPPFVRSNGIVAETDDEDVRSLPLPETSVVDKALQLWFDLKTRAVRNDSYRHLIQCKVVSDFFASSPSS